MFNNSMKSLLYTLLLAATSCLATQAQTADSVKTKKFSYLPKVSGTIRAKAEYQTNEN